MLRAYSEAFFAFWVHWGRKERAAEAPGRIRQALHTSSSNMSTENGLELASHPGLIDKGNVKPSDGEEWPTALTKTVDHLLDGNLSVVSLGGDYSVTYPMLKAYGAHFKPLTIVHLYAHPDLYDELDGNRYSHACPFARIMEEGLASRLVQVGIRTMNHHQRGQAERFGVEVYEMRRWTEFRNVVLEGAIYLSVDMDVLDPAFAPGDRTMNLAA